MPICGIVITLTDDANDRSSVLDQMRTLPYLTVNDTGGTRIPAVIDAPSCQEDRDLFDRIAALSGVATLDLVCVHYEVEDSVVEGSRQP